MSATLLKRAGRGSLATLIAAALVLAAIAAVGPALAQAAAPWWRLDARTAPTVLQPGHEGQIVLSATDVGDAEANGEAGTPIVLTDTLPKGLKVKTKEVEGKNTFEVEGKTAFNRDILECSVAAPTSEGTGETVTCTLKKTLPQFEVVEIVIAVQVEEGPRTVQNVPRIEGGGAAGTTATDTIKVAEEATGFGIERYELTAENEGGSRDAQAGSHPFQLTTNLDLNQALEANPKISFKVASAPALLKDLQVKLPPGLVGDANPEAIPQCSDLDFSTIEPNGNTNRCPANTAVGVAAVSIDEPISFFATHRTVPVFSLTPAPGEPARFGFEVLKVTVVLDTSVLTGGDYSVVASVKNASQAAQILGSQLTLWGEPGNESHDQSRGWHCLIDGRNETPGNPSHSGCAPASRLTKAFLSLPTSCASAWQSSVLADSWIEPGAREADGSAVPGDPRWKTTPQPWTEPALEGCDKLPFEPSISVEPQTHAANSPSGLTVNVHEPQATTLELGGLSASAIKESIVTLPQGVLLSPSAANGLEACSTGLVGFKNFESFDGVSMPAFTRHLPEPVEPGANFCPNGSKVGVVHIKTPDLPNEIAGGVYLAQQNANPFGSLFAMYIIAQDPVSKVTVKLAGEVSLNPSTGQITTSFKNTPQLPFEDLKLELFGGPGASITTPPTCGNYTTSASFVPWSGGPTATPSASFAINSGAEGSGCANPLPLAPGFKAGTVSTQAGGYTPFELTLTHRDSDQAPNGLTMTLPPGLAAMLSSVTLCPEPQASQGTCGPQSLIGHATAVAGLGGSPFTETGGQVFITGPYHGAPFGLTVVIPTHAGPFDFGNVVTRSTLAIDPSTAAVTINSELPTFVNTSSYHTGVPVQLKQIHVVVDRPNFQFNPTNCNPMKIVGTLKGVQGAAASVASPFQVANCASLPFKPALTAKAGAQGSKANGTSLFVNVTAAGLGQANIAKVFLTLPKALPSRLTTIQKACVDAVFNANPAACNEGSLIGKATIHTPVLKSPLSGPAYLVSHGNTGFPDVEFVLQGEGITLILDGKTDIKKGITYSRFESTPDAPFTTFETELPAGPHSALTTNVPESQRYNLCATKLVMPTEITAQNGAKIVQTTKIGLIGCKGVKGFKVTRAQRLAKALKACRKRYKHSKHKRVSCERTARKSFGAKKKGSTKKHVTAKKH